MDDKKYEKEEQKRKKKKKRKKLIAKAISPIITIILIAACLIAIIQGILDVIVGVVEKIMDFVTNPTAVTEKIYKWTSNSASYIFNTGNYQGPNPSGFTIILDEDTVKSIKEEITSQSIGCEEAGLTDVVIKKMILVNYMTSTTVDTEIGLPMSEDEMKEVMEKDKPNKIANGYYSKGIFMYWQGDGKGHGESGKWYVSVQGIILFIDEEGTKINPYDNSPWANDSSNSDFKEIAKAYEKDYEDGKDNTAAAVRETMENAYTVKTIGQIQMNKVRTSNIETVYSYNNEEVIKETKERQYKVEEETIDYSQYISQYVMPMDFLVSLLEITGSNNFVEAVSNLVGNERIEIVISADKVLTQDQDTTTYKDNITVKGKQLVEDKVTTQKKNNGQTVTTTNTASNDQEVSVTKTIESSKDYNVKKEVTTKTEETNYGISIKAALTWYCKVEYDVNSDVKMSYTTEDKDKNEVTDDVTYSSSEMDLKVLDDYLKDAESKRIWVDQKDKNESTNYNELNEKSVKELPDNTKNIDDKLKAIILSKVCYDNDEKKSFFSQENLAKENKKDNNKDEETKKDKDIIKEEKETKYYAARVTNMIESESNIKNSKIKVRLEKITSGSTSVKNYEDYTDRFLGLLKNDTGTYVEGANFNPSGKKVVYEDVYKSNAVVGDLLVNGADALFQFMESTTSYNKNLENVMKYILYRYSGNYYGVTDFKTVIDFLNGSTFSSLGGDSSIECLIKMMASYEGTNTTKDGKKYLILDGYNNDGFHSISTAYGLMFYAKGYNGFEYSKSFNNAFKDSNINTTLEKRLGGLIQSNGEVDATGVSSEFPYYFPEKYAIETEVVEQAMRYILSDKSSAVKKILEDYNKENNKNVVLTQEQINAIIDADWQYANFDPQQFIEEYGKIYNKNGIKTEDLEGLRNKFSAFYDTTYGNRTSNRWKLFKEGVYTLKDGTVLTPSSESGEGVANVAMELVELTKMGGKEETAYEGRRSSKGYSSNIYVCASFVSEALYRATGFTEWSDAVGNLGRNLNKSPDFELVYYKTWSQEEFSGNVNADKKVSDIIQPGDVVGVSKTAGFFDHVVIYIGNDQYAHHGGGSGASNYPNIGSGFFSKYNGNFISGYGIKYIFRAKK